MPVQHEEIMMKDVIYDINFRNYYNKKLSIISYFSSSSSSYNIPANLSGSG